jgi:thiol-disulfide isomerase/thioredoxin
VIVSILQTLACTCGTGERVLTEGENPPEAADDLVSLYLTQSDNVLDAGPLPDVQVVTFNPAGRKNGDLAPVGPTPLVDGTGMYDLASIVGPAGDRAALVAFMASWCQPCEASLPTLLSIHQQRRGEIDIVVYDIDVNATGRQKLLNRLREVGLDVPVLVASPPVQRAWLGQGQSVPRFFFVNRVGEILIQDRGFDDAIAARVPGQVAFTLANPTYIQR